MNDTHIKEDPLMPFKRVNQAFAAREQELHRQLDSLSNLLNQERGNVQAVTTHVQQLAEREQALQEELAELRQQLEAQRAQAQAREDELRQHPAQQLQAQQAAAAQQAEHLQAQIAEAQQRHEAQEAQQQNALAELRQQLEAQRAQAQAREDELRQHSAQQLQAQQSTAAQQAEYLQAQINSQITAMLESIKQQAAYAQGLAERINAMQHTWWWRFAMLWRRPSKWLRHPAPILAQLQFNPPQDNVPFQSAKPNPSAAMPTGETPTEPQPTPNSEQPNHVFSQALPNVRLTMPIQHITELFALDGRLFITEAYRNLLKREPDEHGMAYYLGRLAQGYGKASVIVQLAKSPECRPPHEIIGLRQIIKEEKSNNSWLRIFIRRHGIEKRLDCLSFAISKTAEKLEYLCFDKELKDDLNITHGDLRLDSRCLFNNEAENRDRYTDEKCILPDSPPKRVAEFELSNQIKHANDCFGTIDLYAIIPSYEDYKVLDACIRSIFEYGIGKVRKIIISDDCSSSIEHISYLRRIQSDSANPIPIDVFFKKENGGFSANVNNCLSKIPIGSDVLLLNSDTEVTEHAIEAMTSVARSSLALVGARLLYPDGKIQHGGGFRNFNEPSWFEHLYRGFQEDHKPALVSSNCIFCTGAALYIPSELRKDIGFFDENFKMGFEDVDYCLRAWGKKHPVVYCGTAKIIHHESATRGKTIGPKELDSKSFFWKKYNSFFNQRTVINGSGDICVIFVLKDTGVGGGHRVIFNYANYLCANTFAVEIWALSDNPLWFDLNPNIVFRKFDSFACLEAALSPIDAIKIATWWETAMPVWRASVINGLPAWLAQDFETSYYANRDTFNEIRCFSSYRPEFTYIVNYKWLKKLLSEEMFFHANYVGLAIDSGIFFDKKRVRTPNSVLVCARGEPLKGFSFSKEIIKKLVKKGFYITAYGGDSSLVGDLTGINFIKNPSDALLSELYNSHCYFLQTSIHEGFSLPPIEAMNCGCIPVMTEAHGNLEYIKHNYNCIVIDRNIEHTIDLFSKLNYCDLIQELRPEMEITAGDYNWNKCLPRLKKLLVSIANDGTYGKTKFL